MFADNKKNKGLRALKYIIYILAVAVCAASLFCLSLSVFSGRKAGFEAASVIAFIAAAAVFLLFFILDREKPLVFPVLFILTVVLGIFIPLAFSL